MISHRGSIVCFLFQLILHCLSPQEIQSFSPSSFGVGSLTSIPASRRKELYPHHLNKDDKTEDFIFETVEIRQMITEISFEKNDDIRRGRVESILLENINQNDAEAGARFAMLWDKTLIEIGGEVQNTARAQAELINKERKELEKTVEGTEKGKSEGELKLWALVDMMIQSKALIKKAMDGKQ